MVTVVLNIGNRYFTYGYQRKRTTLKDSRLWIEAPEIYKKTKIKAKRKRLVNLHSFLLYLHSVCFWDVFSTKQGTKAVSFLFSFYPQTFWKSKSANNWTWKLCKNCNSNRKKSIYFCKTLLFIPAGENMHDCLSWFCCSFALSNMGWLAGGLSTVAYKSFTIR